MHVESGGNRVVSLAAAIIAVLAALGTLYAHHASIAALSAKTQAILSQARATDTYNAYEAKQTRYNIYSALLASNLVRDELHRTRLEGIADGERASSPAVLQKAQKLEQEAIGDDRRSDRIIKAYETLQFATTLFEIAIVFVSISALAHSRILLPLGCAVSAAGFVLLVIGLVRNR